MSIVLVLDKWGCESFGWELTLDGLEDPSQANERIGHHDGPVHTLE